jgi:hypothetical protein
VRSKETLPSNLNATRTPNGAACFARLAVFPRQNGGRVYGANPAGP